MYEEYYAEGQNAAEAVERLRKIIHTLRGENGCPWDRAQTHKTLKRCLIEEAYEVTEAIDNEDADNLEEELGDVLLQVVLHGEIGSEKSHFDLKTIANRVSEKMLRRHPHVFISNDLSFSHNSVETIDKVVEKWENVKRKEHKTVTITESMKKIPKELPALIRSEKIQKKAADVGFDWENVDGALDKVREETEELLEIYKGVEINRIAEEVGDLLFAVVNVARFLRVDPEEALHLASQKFINRFGFIEDSATRQGKSVDELDFQEMDKLWEDAKK